MTVAVFDLDDTLLRGDSDKGWGRFLAKRDMVSLQQVEQAYRDHLAGTLDVKGYSEDMLKPLKGFTQADLDVMLNEYLAEHVSGMYCESARKVWDEHQSRGDTMVIASATISIIAEAVSRPFAPHTVLSTTAQWVDAMLTGKVLGEPCFQEGKRDRVVRWLLDNGNTLDDCHFYSDSSNDLPLLEVVETPIAVNPDNNLRAIAEEANWDIRDWHKEALS